MASVEELFRKPTAVSKRKLEDPTTSFSRSSNKSAKLANGASPNSSAGYTPKSTLTSRTSSSRTASVEDEPKPEETADRDDMEAGPVPPPADNVDEAPGDDEEGRFFDTGVSAQEKEVMEYLDQNEDGETEEKIDLQWLKRTTINFERKINKNAELRAKFEDEPMKFVGSEADLDAEIKGLTLLSEHGDLYKEFVKSGSVGSLVSLLAHENTDIAIAVCEVLEELTDEDATTTEEQWKALVDAMIENDLIVLLVSNLYRLNEDANQTDRDGVYHILSLVENLLSQPSNLDAVSSNVNLLQWLLARVNKPDSAARGKVGQNRQYSAEILAILLQGSTSTRERFASSHNGVDILLQILSTYRNRDPEKDSDEEEFVENLFDCLTCCVEETLPTEKFLDGEGVELCLIMLREGKLSKSRALKVLDHAMNGANATAVCDRVIDAAGLKSVFGMLMKSSKKGRVERESVEHIIGIMAGLLRYTLANSASRIRTLAKFTEKEYEKITRFAELRNEYKSRVEKVDGDISAERQRRGVDVDEEIEDEWLSRRLDAGLFSLQSLDVILSWLAAEDEGARERIVELLGDLNGLKSSLQDQIGGLDLENAKGRETREMLDALVGCL